MTALSYRDFLEAKKPVAAQLGPTIDVGELHPALSLHARDIVRWAIPGGRRAIFAKFGLHKTRMQLEICRRIIEKKGGAALISAPLGVRLDFRKDAEALGISLNFGRTDAEMDPRGINLTNHESIREGKIDPNRFTVLDLDEAAVLRDTSSKTFREFYRRSLTVPYKFVATAVPDPNDHIEILNYAMVLGVMDIGEAKTRFFRRNSEKSDALTLHPHKVDEFWLWVSTWACFIQRPSDLGYSDEGYELPPLDVQWHPVHDGQVDAGADREGQGRMFHDAGMGISEQSKAARVSLTARIAKARALVDESPGDTFIFWHHLEDERRALEAAIPGLVSIYGDQDLDEREKLIEQFVAGRIKHFAAKPSMLGSGPNFQHACHRGLYVGVNDKFNEFIQSVHRLHRYQQKHRVRVDVIHAQSQIAIVRRMLADWKRHDETTERTSDIVRRYGLSSVAAIDQLSRSIGMERRIHSGSSLNHPSWVAINNDTVEETATLPDNHVGMILTSVPFSTQYEYTPCYDEQTELLTRRGWTSFGQLTCDDDVATVNQRSLSLEWQRPTHVVWKRYSGPMYHFHDRPAFDLLVTPDHKMFVDPRVGNRKTGRKTAAYQLESAEVMFADFVHRRWRMLAALNDSSGKKPRFIEIPQIEHRQMPRSRHIDRIATEDLMRLAGWYLSEGHARQADRPDRRGCISIAQASVHPENRTEIIDLLTRVGLRVNTNHATNIVVWNISLADFLRREFGRGSYEKRIPRWVKDLHPDLLRILRDTMMKGDGNANGMAYTSYSAALRDDFQEICLVTGWRAAISGNVVRLGQRAIRPEVRSRPERVDYSGMIGCCSVPNRTLIVRRNGKVIVSGNSYNDFGHTDDKAHFFRQMDYLSPELYRVLIPGRVLAVHVKDRVRPGGYDGRSFQSIDPFHADCITHYQRHGFVYMGMITIVTDVVRENNATYRLGWSEQCKDGSRMGVGLPEYVLIFRRPPTDPTAGYSDVPVTKTKEEYTRGRWQIDAHAYWKSNGNRLLEPDELVGEPWKKVFQTFRSWTVATVYDHERTVAIAEAMDQADQLPPDFMLLQPGSDHLDVWTDVMRARTLNGSQAAAGREKHLCPLQFDIVDRLINRFSSPGDVVFDPFGGLGTVALEAVKLGRRGLTVELNPSYHDDAVRYLKAYDEKIDIPTLFDLPDEKAADIFQIHSKTIPEPSDRTLDELVDEGLVVVVDAPMKPKRRRKSVKPVVVAAKVDEESGSVWERWKRRATRSTDLGGDAEVTPGSDFARRRLVQSVKVAGG